MDSAALTALSPVDGRYRATTQALADYFSEAALMRMRLAVECEYLTALSETKGVGMRRLTADEKAILRALPNIAVDDAQIIQKIEREGYDGIPATNHDVKAVEYFVKLKLRNTSLTDVLEWVHFALTSEDVNSTSHALALRGALEEVMLPTLAKVADEIVGLARAHADTGPGSSGGEHGTVGAAPPGSAHAPGHQRERIRGAFPADGRCRR